MAQKAVEEAAATGDEDEKEVTIAKAALSIAELGWSTRTRSPLIFLIIDVFSGASGWAHIFRNRGARRYTRSSRHRSR